MRTFQNSAWELGSLLDYSAFYIHVYIDIHSFGQGVESLSGLELVAAALQRLRKQAPAFRSSDRALL